MKVLHIQKATGLGGSERYLLNLLPKLESRGATTEMCVLVAGDAHRFVDPMRQQGIPTSAIPAGPRVNPLLVPRLARVIRNRRPDVVHTHLPHADLYGQLAARMVGVPGVSTIHITAPFYAKQPYRMLQQIAGRLSRRTICISSHVRNVVGELGLAPAESIEVVPVGVDVEAWTLSEDQRDDARKRFGIAPDEVALGIASRVAAYKGHDFLIDAFIRAREQRGGMRLLVAGDGPLMPHLADRVRQLPEGGVSLLGFIPDVVEFLNACDVVMFPTTPGFGEGLPLVLLEAMAAGRPVVANDVYSVGEAVVDGETGILVDPGSVDDFSRAIVDLVDDPERRERLGANARRRAQDLFSLDASGTKLVEIYRAVVESRPR